MPAILPTLRTLVAGLLLAFALARPAAATDFTDMWWNSTESGWGVNFVQSNDFIFATFFVYDANQQPTWYTGQMKYDSASNTYSGGLFSTTGSYFGGAWIPGQKSITQVGTVSFSPTSSVTGTLRYNVGATSVTKSIQRQTLTAIPLGGSYFGGVVSVFSNCTDPTNNGAVRTFVSIGVTQGTDGTLKLDFLNNSSGAPTNYSFQGSYAQDGQFYRIPGATMTWDGVVVTPNALVSQVKATNQGIEGQWIAPVASQYAGCVETGYFSAVLY